MEAKDTVMNQNKMADVLDKGTPSHWSCTTLEARVLCKAQAEISFKAGEVEGYKQGLEMREPYKAGIRKVVEFMYEGQEGFYQTRDGYYVFHIPKDKLQAKLTEWELDSP